MRDFSALLTEHEKENFALLGFDFNDRVEMDILEIGKMAFRRRSEKILAKASTLPIETQDALLAASSTAIDVELAKLQPPPQE